MTARRLCWAGPSTTCGAMPPIRSWTTPSARMTFPTASPLPSRINCRMAMACVGAAAAPWLLRQTLGGWNLSGAVRLASGFPFPNPVQFSYNPIGNYGFPGSGLPDMVPGISARPAHRSRTNWINPQAFVGQGGVVCTLPNPSCSPFLYKYGNEPQRYTDLREAAQKNVDLSVSKSFGPPRIRTQIRGDFLNVFNHPIYGGSYNISNCLDCGDLGTVYGTRNDPREIQVAAKVIF